MWSMKYNRCRAAAQSMFLAGAKNLEAKKEWINELNVFPVPDGDTGTNMTMTIMSAAKEVAALENPRHGVSVRRPFLPAPCEAPAETPALSCPSFSAALQRKSRTMDEITMTVLANAFDKAAETAYKAVMKPKEGTILTVARGMAEKAAELATETDDDHGMFCREGHRAWAITVLEPDSGNASGAESRQAWWIPADRALCRS